MYEVTKWTHGKNLRTKHAPRYPVYAQDPPSGVLSRARGGNSSGNGGEASRKNGLGKFWLMIGAASILYLSSEGPPPSPNFFRVPARSLDAKIQTQLILGEDLLGREHVNVRDGDKVTKIAKRASKKFSDTISTHVGAVANGVTRGLGSQDTNCDAAPADNAQFAPVVRTTTPTPTPLSEMPAAVEEEYEFVNSYNCDEDSDSEIPSDDLHPDVLRNARNEMRHGKILRRAESRSGPRPKIGCRCTIACLEEECGARKCVVAQDREVMEQVKAVRLPLAKATLSAEEYQRARRKQEQEDHVLFVLAQNKLLSH